MEKKLPSAYRTFAAEHPRVIQAYEQLSEACLAEGPLDRKHAELVKVGIAVGARLEGAVHSHVRRAREAGATADEVAKGKMPPWYYALVHPEARLTAAERAMLDAWTVEAIGRLGP